MKKPSILISAIAIPWLLTGCAGTGNGNDHNRAGLIEYGPRKIDVLITKRLWGGFWGPEGFIGYENEHYRAGLRGSGPEFINPKFQDNPPDIHCVGTITLDREHNRVSIKMRRIISREGQPERSRPHPANGTYTIESTRNAEPGEPSL